MSTHLLESNEQDNVTYIPLLTCSMQEKMRKQGVKAKVAPVLDQESPKTGDRIKIRVQSKLRKKENLSSPWMQIKLMEEVIGEENIFNYMTLNISTPGPETEGQVKLTPGLAWFKMCHLVHENQLKQHLDIFKNPKNQFNDETLYPLCVLMKDKHNGPFKQKDRGEEEKEEMLRQLLEGCGYKSDKSGYSEVILTFPVIEDPEKPMVDPSALTKTATEQVLDTGSTSSRLSSTLNKSILSI